MPNDGQAHLNLQTGHATPNDITSTFQIAKVSRPLMSVGRLGDMGMRVIFDKDRADVVAPDGSVACSFERQNGGLYIGRFRLKKPPPASPFGRQGKR